MAPAMDVVDSVNEHNPAQIKSENSKSVNVIQDMLSKLTVSSSQDEINASSNDLATFINGDIEEQAVPTHAIRMFKSQLADKKNTLARERALVAINSIASHSTVSPSIEPYLVSILPEVLKAVSDKQVQVKNAAEQTAFAIVKATNANAVKAVLPHIITSLRSAQKWPEKICGLKCIETLCASAPAQLALRVPDLIPIVSEVMWDTKPEVKKAAYGTMEKVTALIVNRDIEKFLPELVKCIAKPENVPETVHLLGATTFVTGKHSSKSMTRNVC